MSRGPRRQSLRVVGPGGGRRAGPDTRRGRRDGHTMVNVERQRLRDADASGVPWRQWGPYLSERQWGTVREDYSSGGDAWSAFSHEQARSRAYRWGEDGLAGICDDKQRL